MNDKRRLPVDSRIIREELGAARADKMISQYLIENGVPYADVEVLVESTKTATTSEMAASILNNISEKINKLDLIQIFKSKGDIKSYINLNELQEAIQALESMAAEYKLEDLRAYTNKVVQALVNLNKMANDYKDAFRNKKVLLMTHYAGILQSIIACTAYLVSVSCDVSMNGEINPKNNIKIDNLLYFTALNNFNSQVASNSMKGVVRDVAIMRECYTELSAENLHMITEANDMVDTLIAGAKDMYERLRGAVDGNGMLARLIYKASGIIMLILSLRDSFYTSFRMNTDLSAIVDYISAFAKSQMIGSGSRINNFSRMLSTEMEAASDDAQADVRDEDRAVVQSISKPAPKPVAPTPISEPNTDFDF